MPTTTAASRESLIASPRAQLQAHELSHQINTRKPDASVVVAGVELGEEIRSLLQQIITIIGEGGTVTVGSLPEVVTTTVAADLLGMSRTTLMKLVRSNDIPSRQVGSHTKLRRDDVLSFRRERLRKQRNALDELLAFEDELGL